MTVTPRRLLRTENDEHSGDRIDDDMVDTLCLDSFRDAGAVRNSSLQGMSQCGLGALVLLRQTYRNACPIGIWWVRPTDIDALREHRCGELRLGHTCVSLIRAWATR